MKIYLVHPRRAPNRPEFAYSRREDLPLYATDFDEIVELNVPLRTERLRAAIQDLRTCHQNNEANAYEDVARAFEALLGEPL